MIFLNSCAKSSFDVLDIWSENINQNYRQHKALGQKARVGNWISGGGVQHFKTR